MRCLHCGKRLSLLRKFADAEFCSDEHRQEFQQQQSDLALARLIEAQNRIDRPRPAKPPTPPKPAKSNKKQEVEPVFPMAPVVREPIQAVAALRIYAPALSIECTSAVSGLPDSEFTPTKRGFPGPGPVPVTAPQPAGHPCARNSFLTAKFECDARLPRLGLMQTPFGMPFAAALHSLPLSPFPSEASAPFRAVCFEPGAARTPSLPLCRMALSDVEKPPAPKVEQPVLQPRQPLHVKPVSWLGKRAVPSRPEWPVILPASPSLIVPPAGLLTPGQAALVQPQIYTSPLPIRVLAAQSLLPAHAPAYPRSPSPSLESPRLRSSQRSARLRVKAVAAPKDAVALPVSPSLAAGPALLPPLALSASSPCLQAAGQEPIPVPALAVPSSIAAPAAHSDFSSAQSAFPRLAVSLHAASLPSAQQQDVAVTAQAAAANPGLPWLQGLLAAAQESAYPRPSFRPSPPEHPAASGSVSNSRVLAAGEGDALNPAPADPPQPEDPGNAPEAGETIPPLQQQLPVMLPRPKDRERSKPLWANPPMALRQAPEPRMPSCRLSTDQADGSGPRHRREQEAAKKASQRLGLSKIPVPGRRFWVHAPADLKWVAIGLPLLLVLVVYSFRSSGPKVEPVQDAVASTGSGSTALGGQMNALQRVILNRAAVKLYDDFRGGLGAWQGGEGWSKTWKYGEASFLEPGQIALYAPSVGMRDYTFQFLGQIERRSLNWVFRAADARNYYAMRIVITKAGPLPEAVLVRSTFIDGKERDIKTLPVPFPIQADTLYLVRMDIRGHDFTTYIQGQVVDSFTDSSLEEGGIGFYCGKAEKSRLRWVEVTHQYDFLGRLCAMLAPYDITAQSKRAN